MSAMMDCGEHVGFGMIQEQFQNRQNIPEAFPINTDIVSIIKLLIQPSLLLIHSSSILS
jgi:hypothetical protein